MVGRELGDVFTATGPPRTASCSRAGHQQHLAPGRRLRRQGRRDRRVRGPRRRRPHASWPRSSSASCRVTSGTVMIEGQRGPHRASPRMPSARASASHPRTASARASSLIRSVLENATHRHPAAADPLPLRAAPRWSAGSPASTSSGSTCAHRPSTRRWASCPAATSRRSCWHAGWRPSPRCSSSTSPPAASTSVPRRRSTGSSTSSPTRASPSCSSPRSCRRSWASRTASSSCRAAASPGSCRRPGDDGGAGAGAGHGASHLMARRATLPPGSSGSAGRRT